MLNEYSRLHFNIFININRLINTIIVYYHAKLGAYSRRMSHMKIHVYHRFSQYFHMRYFSRIKP